MTPTSRGPGVLDKALRLLELVAAVDGITLTDIAHRAGLPISTAHRFATTLCNHGCLERDDLGRYHVGMRLWEIASSAPRARTLREIVRPYLEDLHFATKQNIQLALLEDDEALIVEHLRREGPATAARIGGRLPLHASGVGQVLLAWGSTEVRKRVLDSDLTSYTPQTISSSSALRLQLDRIRREGYAVVDRTMPLPALSISSPVLGRGGQCLGAIALVLPTETDPTPYISAVMTAARSASRLMTSRQTNISSIALNGYQ